MDIKKGNIQKISENITEYKWYENFKNILGEEETAWLEIWNRNRGSSRINQRDNWKTREHKYIGKK